MQWRSFVLAIALALGLLPAFGPIAAARGDDLPSTVRQSPVKPDLGLAHRAPVTCGPEQPCAAAALVGMPVSHWVSIPTSASLLGWHLPQRVAGMSMVLAQASVPPDTTPPRPFIS